MRTFNQYLPKHSHLVNWLTSYISLFCTVFIYFSNKTKTYFCWRKQKYKNPNQSNWPWRGEHVSLEVTCTQMWLLRTAHHHHYCKSDEQLARSMTTSWLTATLHKKWLVASDWWVSIKVHVVLCLRRKYIDRKPFVQKSRPFHPTQL